MVRNTADACMFCGQNPCACGKPARAKPKLQPKTSPSEMGSKIGPAAAVVPAVRKAAPTVQSVVGATRRPDLSNVTRVRDPEQEQLSKAVTLFAERDMLHADSLREHRKLIRLPPSQVDAMIWKQVNKEHGNQ